MAADNSQVLEDSHVLSVRSIGFLLAGLLTLVQAGPAAQAQQSGASRGFQFPANAFSWINSVPFSAQQLKGKAAVMVFFEEG